MYIFPVTFHSLLVYGLTLLQHCLVSLYFTGSRPEVENDIPAGTVSGWRDDGFPYMWRFWARVVGYFDMVGYWRKPQEYFFRTNFSLSTPAEICLVLLF